MKLHDSYVETLMMRINSAISNSGSAASSPAVAPSAACASDEYSSSPVDGSTDLGEDRPSIRQRIVEAKLGLNSGPSAAGHDSSTAAASHEFWPLAPPSWEEMKFTSVEAEELVLKCLRNLGTASGRDLSDHIAIPFGLLNALLQQLKTSRLVIHRGAAALGDYLYQLSEAGIEVATRYDHRCAYDGAAPVVLEDYIASVHAQSVYRHPPTAAEIADVFSDLVLSEDILEQVGQAIHAGHGFFLYGDSGNGKTSLAERVSRAFGQTIWIPRSLSIDGVIIRLFDPCNHVEVPPENKDGLYDKLKIDRRWVRIVRPTILVGGELTMDRLEIRPGTAPGVLEAPLQMKSNCGTLVIDDFGRQRISPDQLLNRWIVPLDRRHDFLNLPNGKTIQVPFDQVLIFSSNMQPHELADEAFLRRIPYKIRAVDPTEAEFRELMKREAKRMGFRYCEATIDELIQTHYATTGRPFRGCHARDLLRQIKHYCEFRQLPLEMSPERFDTAVRSYFAMVAPNSHERA